jgi:hydroxyethylthiazole kinase-like uncharacterized protein yjeF
VSRDRHPVRLAPDTLRDIPLPAPDAGGDKDERGRVLIAGGSRENPGALLLAGTAALRAGAGKLKLATVASAVVPLAVAVPEARVYPLGETGDGHLAPSSASRLAELGSSVDALLLGPGMVDEETATAFTRRVLTGLKDVAVVVDAGGFGALREDRRALHGLGGRAVVTPHAGEMAMMLGMEKDAVAADPLRVAREAAETLGAVVALKGPRTFIVDPGGAAYVYEGGDVVLATSGSGDVLAGIVAGLLARGAEPVRAAAWAVWLHGEAGNALVRRHGRLGALARELPDEVPRLISIPSVG